MGNALNKTESLGLSAIYPVICVSSPSENARSFKALFPLDVVFETDWYVHLKSGSFQLGFVRFDHASVPLTNRSISKGAFITVDADDVKSVWDQKHKELQIVQPLTDESWGQRHFICQMPDGVLVDVVQMLG